MQNVIMTAIIDFGLYSLFVLIYTLVGAYQNINVWGMSFDWKRYVNGLVKWLALGGAVVGSVVGSFLLLAQAEAQGIELVNVQAVAPRVIFGTVLIASAIMLGKIITKLATTLGVDETMLKKIQEQSVNTDADKTLVFNLDNLPMPSEDYIKSKIKDETEGGVGTFYSVPTGSYQEFKNAVNGNGYDIDNYYGWQCWDGTALLWQQFGKSLVTGNGLAIGCWDLKRDVNAYDLFDLVTDVNSLREGDVVVMRPNHIGFFDGYNGGNMRILGQNQGGRANSAGGSAFNVVNIAKSSFAGAFRLKKWNSVAPTPTPTPTPAPTPTKSVDEVAREVMRGDWGNGDDRKNRLTQAGYDYAQVQGRVNEIRAGQTSGVVPAPTPASSFSVGDVVVPTRRVSYDGVALTQWDDNYTISELRGDRAVLMARGQVWSAMNTNDIKKA
jgi:hypothetical protein